MVDDIVAIPEQAVDRHAVKLDQAREVQVDDPAQGRELLALGAPSEVLHHELVLRDERLHRHPIFHRVLNDLLKDVIEVIPVDILVFIKTLEVDVNHFIDLFR